MYLILPASCISNWSACFWDSATDDIDDDDDGVVVVDADADDDDVDDVDDDVDDDAAAAAADEDAIDVWLSMLSTLHSMYGLTLFRWVKF